MEFRCCNCCCLISLNRLNESGYCKLCDPKEKEDIIEKLEKQYLKEDIINKCNICRKENFECKERDDICQECYNREKPRLSDDIINKPNHYHSNGIDPIGIGEKIFTEDEMLGFYKMNVLKYRMRAGKKEGNSEEQDLLKADFYEKKIKDVYNARIHCGRK